jgi:uncharacterized protein with ATP-grasp and redox domains
MQMYLECVPCFARQALQAAEFSGAGPATRERVLRKGLRALEGMAWNKSPMEMARTVHALVRRETGVDDPYRAVKEESNRLALEWYGAVAGGDGDGKPSMETAIRLAIAGNVLDYGANATVDLAGSINELLARPLALSDETQFLRELESARTIAYLADNAGEVVFDRLLLETIRRLYGPKECLFVTRKGPFINDALIEDAAAAGVTELPDTEVVAMRAVAPAAMTDPEDTELWRRIRLCDVVISKGQGNYEGFSREPGIYFLLVVKCPVVGRDLGAQAGQRMHVGDVVLWKNRHRGARSGTHGEACVPSVKSPGEEDLQC